MEMDVVFNFIYYLFFLIFAANSIDGKELLYFSEGATWVEARNICRSHNGQLMMSNALNRDILNNCPEIQTNQRFWVGEYKTLSPWFEIIGCFSSGDIQSNVTYDNSFRNEVSVCHKVCNTSRVGLQGKKCHCLNEDFSGIQNTASANCDTVCGGNSAEYCGGNDVINVYRTVTHVPSDDICPFGDICLCAQMDCQLTGVAYSARPCQERMQGACGSWFLSDVKDSWSASNDRCSAQGYLTNQENARTFCENRPSSSPESFWSGVFRSAIHNYDQVSPIIDEQLLYCFTLTKGVIFDSTRSDGREMDTCYNKRLPFVCEIGTSTFGQATCSMFIPPSVKTEKVTTTPAPASSTYVMGQNDPEGDIANIGIIVALTTGGGLLLLLVIMVICIVQKRRDSNYRRKFKSPYIINSYGNDINIDAQPRKNIKTLHENSSENSPASVKKGSSKVHTSRKTNPKNMNAIYSVPAKKLTSLAESEIYVLSSDCDESDIIPRPRVKKGIMKKPIKSVQMNTRVETDSGIEDSRDLRCLNKNVYDGDTSSYSEDSIRKCKIDKSTPETVNGMEDEKSPYRYVYSEF